MPQPSGRPIPCLVKLYFGKADDLLELVTIHSKQDVTGDRLQG